MSDAISRIAFKMLTFLFASKAQKSRVPLGMQSASVLRRAAIAARISLAPHTEPVHMILAALWLPSECIASIFKSLGKNVEEAASAVEAQLPIPLDTWETQRDSWDLCRASTPSAATHRMTRQAGILAAECGSHCILPEHLILAAMPLDDAASAQLRRFLPEPADFQAMIRGFAAEPPLRK